MESYQRLAQAYELIVLEGAGSAVELNLKADDLVNFSMAKRAGAAVLLVADIDRGGVFAATIGAFHLLTASERRMLQGFIINKFRGDAALFTTGVGIIEARTKRPVLGVLPYDPDLVLPEEDSVALGKKRRGRRLGGGRGPEDRRAAPAPYLQLYRLRPPGAGAGGGAALPGPPG